MTSVISGVNFSGPGSIKINPYNMKSNIVGATVKYTTQTYDEDTISVETYEEEKTDVTFKAFLKDIKNKNNWGNVALKGASNAVFYTGTQLMFNKENIQTIIDVVNSSKGLGTSCSVPVLTFVSLASGLTKVVSGKMTGKEFSISFIEGFSKPLIKALVEKRVDVIAQSGFGTLLPKVDSKAISTIMEKGAKIGKVYKDPTKYKTSLLSGGSKAANEIFKTQMFNSLSQMGISCGVDYVASVGVNVITGLLDDGKVDWDEAKLGSTLLKSSWKTVCATAFESMGTFAGPAGRKVGKTIGTIVGSTIGEFMVKVFDGDEGWCAAAGVATIAGAAVGGVVATICCTAGVIAVSVPVAGWIVGGAIIVGAAVGTFAVWLVKTLSGG